MKKCCSDGRCQSDRQFNRSNYDNASTPTISASEPDQDGENCVELKLNGYAPEGSVDLKICPGIKVMNGQRVSNQLNQL